MGADRDGRAGVVGEGSDQGRRQSPERLDHHRVMIVTTADALLKGARRFATALPAYACSVRIAGRVVAVTMSALGH
jgi:hypothetical protein